MAFTRLVAVSVLVCGSLTIEEGWLASESKDAAIRLNEGDLVSREAVCLTGGSGGRLGRGRLPSDLPLPPRTMGLMTIRTSWITDPTRAQSTSRVGRSSA